MPLILLGKQKKRLKKRLDAGRDLDEAAAEARTQPQNELHESRLLAIHPMQELKERSLKEITPEALYLDDESQKNLLNRKTSGAEMALSAISIGKIRSELRLHQR